MSDPSVVAPRQRALMARLMFVLMLLALSFCLIGVGLMVSALDWTEPFPPLVLVGVLFLILIGLFGLGLAFKRRPASTSVGSIAEWLANAASEGVLVVDPASDQIVYANAAYLAFCGVADLDQLTDIGGLFGPTGEATDALMRLSIASEQGDEAHEDIRLTRGLTSPQPAWYRLRTAPLVLKGRQPLTLWSVSDITRERERQESVFQELQYAIDYLDHAPAGFLSFNPDGEIIYLNATLAGWLKRDLNDFGPGGLALSDLVTSNGLVLLRPTTGAPGETTTHIIDTDFIGFGDQIMPVKLLHQVTYDDEGMSGASRTLVLNRSQSETSEEGQRIAEIRFARFFNNSPFGIATVSASGLILRMNASFVRLMPFDDPNDAEAAKVTIHAILTEVDRGPLAERLAQAVAGKADQPPLDVKLELKSRSARVYVTSLEGVGEADEAAIVYVLDTTDQRELEAQFAQAQKMQAVGELAGGIAHDFNNVLQGILGYADLLLANHRPTDPSFQDIMQIKQNGNRAASLVRHLLAFSRRQTLRPVVIQFTEVLSDLSTLLKRLLGQRIEFDVRHERDLWLVKADPTQFEQVIINLAMNARDAMLDGGKLMIRTANVSEAASRALGDSSIPIAEYVMVEIADTGAGIAPDILAKIFEPFFTTKEVGKGTGLGLSMVYGFVKQSGGYILCDSTVGEGTRFRILLPRHQGTVEEAATAQADAAVSQKHVPVDLSGQGTVLLVEDEDAVRAFSARALVQRGYKVLEAASGVEALEILAELESDVDLIVSDVVMPEMDGPSFLREARARGIKARIIFASGYAEEAFSKNLPEGEEFGFLPKPFSLKQLIETVKAAIG